MLHEGKVGSITHTVDMNGSVRNEYDYDTFGTRTNIKTANIGSNQHYGYTGEAQDAESGLLYLRARYYDPSIGRFISADPYLGRMAEPVTQNRYIYVHNNPLLFVDPSGLCSVLDTATPWVDCINDSLGIDFGPALNSVGNYFTDPVAMSNASAILAVPVAPLLATGGGAPVGLALGALSALADARSQQLQPNIAQFSQENLVNLAIMAIPAVPVSTQSLAASVVNRTIDYFQAEDAAYFQNAETSYICQ